MEKLKAYYFTGTGNTRYVTEKLCGYLQDRYDTETFDVTKTASVSSADLLLFAFPVYGSSPPKPMVRFVLNNAQKIRGQECIVIATQYKFSGDGAASLGRLLEKTGAKVSFAEHFNMPNNLSDCAMFKIRNGAELKDTLERAEKKAQCFAGRILKGKKFRRGFNPLSHSVGYVCQRKWWRKGENEKKSSLQIDAQKCVGCGLCAGRCPVHNIRIENGKAVVTFRNAKELKTKDGKPAKYFEIAGADNKFHPATVTLNGNKATLSSDKVAKPYLVRYAWNHNITTNLVNENNLPAGAFRASIPVPVRDALDRLVPEAKNMKVAYALSAKKIWESGSPLYKQNNSKALAGKKIKTIGYFMHLISNDGKESYVFATVDPFTQDVAKLGLPTAADNNSFQQIVKNLTVKTNVAGLSSGKFEDGNVEMWCGNYGTQNSAKVPGATDNNYDFGDSKTSNRDEYGSFQLHNYKLKQTVFAMNNFRSGTPDVGIGTNKNGHPDYTFTNSTRGYTVADLLILIDAE